MLAPQSGPAPRPRRTSSPSGTCAILVRTLSYSALAMIPFPSWPQGSYQRPES
jgi:hypothetical protein